MLLSDNIAQISPQPGICVPRRLELQTQILEDDRILTLPKPAPRSPGYKTWSQHARYQTLFPICSHHPELLPKLQVADHMKLSDTSFLRNPYYFITNYIERGTYPGRFENARHQIQNMVCYFKHIWISP